MFHVEGDNIFSEVIPFNKGKKILIYLEKLGDFFDTSCKCFGTHYLEQIIDENGKIISESIKKNPHFVKLEGFSSLDYD